MAAASRHRWFYNNLMTTANAVVSEVATGSISNAVKTVASGGASGSPGGVFNGSADIAVVVEIADITAGTQIGQATFRYSIDGGSTWTTSGITTATTATSLTQGLTFQFGAAASGNDFVVGDRWEFQASLQYGLEALLDFQSRNREYRSAGVASMVTFTVTLSAPALVRSLILMDHNLTSAAVVRIRGNSSASWASTPINELLTYAATHMAKVFDGGTYGFWQVQITDTGNTDGYIRIGKMFVGDYQQCTSRGSSLLPFEPTVEPKGILIEDEITGSRRQTVVATRTVYPIIMWKITQADRDNLVTMRDAVWDATTTKLHRPLIFMVSHLSPNTVSLCWLDEFRDRAIAWKGSLSDAGPGRGRGLRYVVDMTLRQVVKV